MVTDPETLELPVRRGKLRLPRPGSGLVARPRLTARLDESLRVPLTLVAAPAGFGKTTLLTEWAASHPAPLAWLSLDANDRTLKRFVPHMVAAIETLVPGIGLPVLDLLRQPNPLSAADIGAALADELLDLPHDIVLIIDDYQIAASGDVEQFLAGLHQATAPLFHLLLATRSDPALPLARMRLHGHVRELRARDLRFSDDEARQLLLAAGHGERTPEMIATLQQQTGGWIAGLRLATLALPAGEDWTRIAAAVAGEQHLMDFLVEEVLATQSAATQDFLLRTAIVDRICAPLADALLDRVHPGGSRATLERLAHDCLFLEPAGDDGEWFRYHPLFRSLLSHQLELRLARGEIATLHARASDWFAAQGLLDQAIQHRLTAGDVTGAAFLVEQHAHAALDREDWTSLSGWLQQLPESVIHGRPALLLAKAWVSHFSGRAVPIRSMLLELNALLAKGNVDPATMAALEAERDALAIGALLPSDRDAEANVAFARHAVAHISTRHRLASGLASYGLGCALQAAGRTDEAIQWLTAAAERHEERIDAGSIRALGGLMFVHRQAGNPRAAEEVARHILTLALRQDLPVATGWARWMLGWLAYERDELETATEHFLAIVADAQRVHLHCACEAMFGLTLAYQANELPVAAAGTMRRLLEMILDANALEYLPLVRGFEARLVLLGADPQRAMDWLEVEDVGLHSTSLDAFDQPYLTRIKVLLAEGSPASLARAGQDLEAFRTFTGTRHHRAHQVEALVLAALVLDAQGQTEDALGTLERSVALAAAAGGLRTYLDLGPAAASLLRRLAVRGSTILFLHQIVTACTSTHDAAFHAAELAAASTLPAPILELLTAREADVLACLYRRLTYEEIGEQLYISMQTVKSHAASIYAKLDVGNRRQALAKAAALGWFPPT